MQASGPASQPPSRSASLPGSPVTCRPFRGLTCRLTCGQTCGMLPPTTATAAHTTTPTSTTCTTRIAFGTLATPSSTSTGPPLRLRLFVFRLLVLVAQLILAPRPPKPSGSQLARSRQPFGGSSARDGAEARARLSRSSYAPSSEGQQGHRVRWCLVALQGPCCQAARRGSWLKANSDARNGDSGAAA